MSLKWNTVGAALLLVAFMLIHVRIEELSLNIGLSWTFSKLAPYLVQFVLIIMLSAMLSQLFGSNFGKKKLILVSSVLVFSGIAFAFNPIYEGDFDNGIEELIFTNSDDEFQEGLTMIALPGCKYCLERIETLNKLKGRSAELPIHVIVVQDDSLVLAEYAQRLAGNIQITTAQNTKQINQLIGGSYPAFVYTVKKNRPRYYYWDQIGFGTGALDWITEKY